MGEQKLVPFIKHLLNGVNKGAVDIFVQAGSPVQAKVKGQIVNLTDDTILTPDDVKSYMLDIYTKMAYRPKSLLDQLSDDDFSFLVPDVARFRINVYHQRNSVAAVIRIVPFHIPTAAEMHIPENIMALADNPSGLIIISGLACSGKSTTQACFIDRINHMRYSHIITIEDPIEFIHRNDKSLITQREVPIDTPDIRTAVNSALRQTPDVLSLSNMPETDVIGKIIDTAECGHLVIATCNAQSPADAIFKILNVFPKENKELVRLQMANALVAVVQQRLISDESGNVTPRFEVLKNSSEVKDYIIQENVDALREKSVKYQV